MQTLAIFIISFGAWVIYAGWKGIDPIATAFQVIQKPGDAQTIISEESQIAALEVQTLYAAAGTTTASSAAAASSTPEGVGDAAAVVTFARRQIGKPYRLGAAGPDAWDCSGLVMKAYATIGVRTAHSALAQSLKGTIITDKSSLAAGDLLFPTGLGVAAIGDHVQIYSGANTVIEAANPDAGVREIALDHWWKGDKVMARRWVHHKAQTSGNGSRILRRAV